MHTIKKWLLYSIYILAVTGIFLYYLFPSDVIKKHILSKANENGSEISVTMDRVKPAFPPGLKFHDVAISHKDSPAISAEWLKIIPKYLTLFGSAPAFSFKGRSCEGQIKGKAVITKPDTEASSAGEMTLDTNLAGLHIEDIHIIQDPDQYEISGMLDGNITYTRNVSDETLHAKLTGSNGKIEFAGPVFSEMGLLGSIFSVESLDFDNIDADVAIKNSKNIEIKDFTLKGKQLRGNLSGSVELRIPQERSRLNLTGSIKPYPSLMESLGPAAALLPKGTGEDGFPFKISGTFERPKFYLK